MRSPGPVPAGLCPALVSSGAAPHPGELRKTPRGGGQEGMPVSSLPPPGLNIVWTDRWTAGSTCTSQQSICRAPQLLPATPRRWLSPPLPSHPPQTPTPAPRHPQLPPHHPTDTPSPHHGLCVLPPGWGPGWPHRAPKTSPSPPGEHARNVVGFETGARDERDQGEKSPGEGERLL